MTAKSERLSVLSDAEQEHCMGYRISTMPNDWST
jgi:hypothetical protein